MKILRENIISISFGFTVGTLVCFGAFWLRRDLDWNTNSTIIGSLLGGLFIVFGAFLGYYLTIYKPKKDRDQDLLEHLITIIHKNSYTLYDYFISENKSFRLFKSYVDINIKTYQDIKPLIIEILENLNEGNISQSLVNIRKFLTIKDEEKAIEILNGLIKNSSLQTEYGKLVFEKSYRELLLVSHSNTINRSGFTYQERYPLTLLNLKSVNPMDFLFLFKERYENGVNVIVLIDDLLLQINNLDEAFSFRKMHLRDNNLFWVDVANLQYVNLVCEIFVYHLVLRTTLLKVYHKKYNKIFNPNINPANTKEIIFNEEFLRSLFVNQAEEDGKTNEEIINIRIAKYNGIFYHIIAKNYVVED